MIRDEDQPKLDVLNDQYQRGEISREEYVRRVDELTEDVPVEESGFMINPAGSEDDPFGEDEEDADQ